MSKESELLIKNLLEKAELRANCFRSKYHQIFKGKLSFILKPPKIEKQAISLNAFYELNIPLVEVRHRHFRKSTANISDE